jgi:thiol-disulfide isomerase/thioredoxin
MKLRKNKILQFLLCFFILLVLYGCGKENDVKYAKESQFLNFLDSKKIDPKNTIFVILFNNYCTPCLEETKKFVQTLPKSDKIVTKNKILICSECEFFGKENFSDYQIVEETRENLEGIGLYSPDNYVLEFDFDGQIIAFSNLRTENFPNLRSDYNIDY